MENIISISRAAAMLGLNIQTLRRWDKSGELSAKRDASGRLFYYPGDLEDFLKAHYKYFFKISDNWAYAKNAPALPDGFYCPDRSVFKARLSRFEADLKNQPLFKENYSLIVAVAGEIGNNSFDHNLGNWPDILGIFFGYILKERTVILADRGQGILATLKRVAPDLITHQDGLKTAFTKIISGRAPENRGNGLKFVKQVVQDNNFSLFFQSGDAMLVLNNKSSTFSQSVRPCEKNFHKATMWQAQRQQLVSEQNRSVSAKVLDKNNGEVSPVNTGDHFLQGCFAKLNF